MRLNVKPNIRPTISPNMRLNISPNISPNIRPTINPNMRPTISPNIKLNIRLKRMLFLISLIGNTIRTFPQKHIELMLVIIPALRKLTRQELIEGCIPISHAGAQRRVGPAVDKRLCEQH